MRLYRTDGNTRDSQEINVDVLMSVTKVEEERQKNKSALWMHALLFTDSHASGYECNHLNFLTLVCASFSFMSHQTVQLGHGVLASWLADVPHLDAALPSGVDVASRGADGDGAHHLSVAQGVDLTGVTRDSRTQQSVGRKGHGLHLTVRAHVERIGAEKG